MNRADADAGTCPDPSDDSRLVEAVRRFQQAMESGQPIDRAAFLARYPDLAEQLVPCLDGLLLLREALPAPGVPAALPENDLGGTPLGDYRLLREVGRGGMAVVYEAMQLSLNRRVALKVLPFANTLDARQLQRFRNEAVAAAQLHHPHIVQVHGVGCEGGVYYYAMQFVDGLSLADVIRRLRVDDAGEEPRREGYLTRGKPGEPPASTTPRAHQSTRRSGTDSQHFRTVAEWVRQAAEALEYAHSFGVVHRDIKPANLLIDRHGSLFVVDFGLAHVGGDDALTRTGDILGTLRYMAPEQARGERVADPRTDVYALGVTLYELLTLQPAFTAASRQELLHAVLEMEPTPARKLNRSVPVELEVIAHKAMARNPGDRYRSARALADDLRRFLDDQPITARPPSLRQKTARWARRHPAVVTALVAAALVAVLAGAIGAVWRERQRGEERARQAILEQQERDALAESEGHLRQRRLPAAREALARAEGLQEGGGESMRDRAAQLRRDLTLLTRLEDMSLNAALTDVRGRSFGGWDVAVIRDVLQEYGLDRNRPPAETAGWLLRSVVASELLGALERWRDATRDRAESDWLVQVLATAVRSEEATLRAWWSAVVRRDRGVLAGLARRLDVERLPASLVLRMAHQLRWTVGFHSAADLLKRARPYNARDFWINHNLGIVLAHSQPPDLEGAARYLTAAVSLRDDSAGAWANLSNVLQMLGQLDQAEQAARRAVKLQPGNSATHVVLGNALAERGEDRKAEAEYRRAIAINPSDAEAHHDLGLVQFRAKKYDQAETSQRRAIRQRRPYPEAQYSLGQALLAQYRYAESEKAFRRALAQRPDHAETFCEMGRALVCQLDFVKAEAAFRQALRLRPDFSRAAGLLSVSLSGQGKYRKAEAVCRKLLGARPNEPEAYHPLGLALLGQRKHAQAEEAFETALKLKPEEGETCRILVQTLLIQNKYARAEIVAWRLVKLLPGAPSHYTLGRAQFGQGKFPAAQKAFRKAIEFQPGHAKSHCFLGLALRNQGQLSKALQSLQRGHDLGVRQPGSALPSRAWIREAQRLLRMEQRLPDVLAGKRKLSGPKEIAEHAALCGLTRRFAGAAQLYAELFAAEPKLADDPGNGHRYSAACSAVQAGAGLGRDPVASAEERARWRKQALDWLAAELHALAKYAGSGKESDRASVRQALNTWLSDPDLASVRAEAINRLPEGERDGWRRLWAEVEMLRKKLAAP
jgi:serine/threonine protein kinase/Flp pilus assembly protein TadD